MCTSNIRVVIERWKEERLYKRYLQRNHLIKLDLLLSSERKKREEHSTPVHKINRERKERRGKSGNDKGSCSTTQDKNI
ncbi:hypothetical protein BDF14DRAFT_1827364 [Spinellus fusiger]|nr:hypothetical protein BDF14DRAFT_1827364 [Spinellus fusiger]